MTRLALLMPLYVCHQTHILFVQLVFTSVALTFAVALLVCFFDCSVFDLGMCVWVFLCNTEEEIDVVTVRRCNTFTRSQQQKDDGRREQQQALKRCHLEIQQQHNYAAPRPASPPLPLLSVKRVRGNMRHFTSRHACDLEDDERRRTHNVMERQRRNELKNCFLRLRDHVPELSNNDKASKVIILKRAKESIHNLESEAQTLSQKRDRLREKQEQLKARLEQLKRF